MTVTDAEVTDADQSDGTAVLSHGLLGRTWAVLRANWLIIGLFAVLYRVPNWLVYGICNVTGAPWCSPDPNDFEAFNRWATSMAPNLSAGMAVLLSLFVGAVISTLFVTVLAALWTGRWLRVGRGEAREALVGFSWTKMRRVVGVDVVAMVPGLILIGVIEIASTVFNVDIFDLLPGSVPTVASVYNFLAVVLSTLVAPLLLLWMVAIVIDDLPVWSALRRTWATITRSPGAVAAPLLILALAQSNLSGVLVAQVLHSLNFKAFDGLWATSTEYWTEYWVSASFSLIWSVALLMVSSTLAVGLWLRARDCRVEPAELWRGGGGAEVAGDALQAVAQ